MRDIEHRIAVAFMIWWSYFHKRFALDQRLLYAIPNGGMRRLAVARKLKSEGVRAGVADYFLAVPRNGKHGLYIELKAGGPGIVNGRPTEDQLAFGCLVQEQGYEFRVAYGTDEAIDAVSSYLSVEVVR